jgi:signal transduction histidine kinase
MLVTLGTISDGGAALVKAAAETAPVVAPRLNQGGTALVTAVIVSVVGLLILWSNPKRTVNRVVLSCSLHLSTWLLFLHLTLTSETNGLFWLRLTCAVGSSVPLHFWLVEKSIAHTSANWIRTSYRMALAWIVISIALTILPLTDHFIPSHSTATQRVVGWGYSAYTVSLFVLYGFLLIDTFRATKQLTGSRKLELQVWLLGGCVMTTLILGLMVLNALTHDRRVIRLQPLVVLLFYASTVIAITTNRIFDARQMMRVFAEKAVLIFSTAGAAYFIDVALAPLLPAPFDFLATTALTLWFAFGLNDWLNRLFQFYPQATKAREAAFAAAGREAQVDKLELAFFSILKGWGQSDRALVLSGNQGALSGGGIELDENSTVAKTMRQIRWATPERLAREKPTPERTILANFLNDHSLGVLVCSEGLALKVLVGVGVPASRRPFTYPQVMQLLELSAIIENALERAHLSAKAQHAEQLATVGLLGASLAHEIRNPLVSIKTFVQLLPDHYQDQAFRDKFFRLIGDEVTRIDRLTEQLLDLASPRVYTAKSVELHLVIQTGLDLVAAKAAGKNIELRQDLSAKPDLAYTDAAAVKQVLLNLCFNAIQAVETQFGERWLLVATRKTPDGLEMSVSDSGPGIATEIMPRLFQPFQSTKSSGFGLGLAICRDILGNLNAVITVDQPVPGSGATFRVIFPCQPS